MTLDQSDTASAPGTLANQLTEAVCLECGVTEWLIPLDSPLDSIFLANYRCDECEETERNP